MVDDFWADFVKATGIDGKYEAWAFAAGIPDLATELALLVRDGPKRATAGLLADVDPASAPMPAVGDLNVILDGSGTPVCVIRTTQVETSRFGDVDEAFAWDECEGDRTLAWWRQAHIWYYSEQGTHIDEDTPMILERFELLYPVGTD